MRHGAAKVLLRCHSNDKNKKKTGRLVKHAIYIYCFEFHCWHHKQPSAGHISPSRHYSQRNKWIFQKWTQHGKRDWYTTYIYFRHHTRAKAHFRLQLRFICGVVLIYHDYRKYNNAGTHMWMYLGAQSYDEDEESVKLKIPWRNWCIETIYQRNLIIIICKKRFDFSFLLFHTK